MVHPDSIVKMIDVIKKGMLNMKEANARLGRENMSLRDENVLLLKRIEEMKAIMENDRKTIHALLDGYETVESQPEMKAPPTSEQPRVAKRACIEK